MRRRPLRAVLPRCVLPTATPVQALHGRSVLIVVPARFHSALDPVEPLQPLPLDASRDGVLDSTVLEGAQHRPP